MVEPEPRGLAIQSSSHIRTDTWQLKNPPIHSLRHKEDPIFHPTPALSTILSGAPALPDVHPQPKHIYRLWHVFVESVNPLIKLIHVPSLQQRVLDASWEPCAASKPLTAMLFAIYTLAIISLSSEDCQASFGEPRGTILTRFRAAALRALVDADFLTTRDLKVLQAFVLFLLADAESELAYPLTGAAVRVGQKMGLHRETSDAKTSFFEREMRVRLWWHICRLHSKTPNGTKPPPSELGCVRAPLNVNDADLHLEMTEAPMEHSGPTEMMFVLLKFEVSNWLRSSAAAAEVFEGIFRGPPKGRSTELEDKAINELEEIYHEKFLRNVDQCIPLHALTQAVAKLAIARMRFKVHHPRGRITQGNEAYTTQKDSDTLFESALTMLEMVDVGMRSKFCSHLFADMTTKFQMDAYVYVLSELRRRMATDRVVMAWRMVEKMYEEHAGMLDEGGDRFWFELGELTLEAWEARRGELSRQGVWTEDMKPRFIRELQERRKGYNKDSSLLVGSEVQGFGGLMENGQLDWEYWDDFLRL